MKNNILIFTLVGVLCLTNQHVFCQIFKEEPPVSFLYNMRTEIERHNLDVQITKVGDNARTQIIDNETVVISDPIIGELFDVSININNRGRWTTLDNKNNGDKIWQMQIDSKAGSYMMLIFDDFYLPKGSKLFVYSADRTQVLGAFTEENNVPSRQFTTPPLKTNSIVVEYFQPYYVKEQPKLNLQSVGLIDDSFTNVSGTRNFGTSANCMINAMCPQYNGWCNQRRSVALIFRVFTDINQIRLCSGSLLTNERRDGTPFFLTAFHCADRDGNGSISQAELNEVRNWAFVFNYQSPDCVNPPIEPPLVFFISGATYLNGIGNSGTDYALLQLDRKPPANFNAYYNGWTNDSGDMTNTGVTVHHPAADIKKISEWARVNSHTNLWEVRWTAGSAQPGSSGAPLFNSSGFVVGQCSYGNNQVCLNTERTNYGRFNRSWHNYGLCNELNPNGSHSGSYQIWVSSTGGEETCRQDWIFNNCNDLHTSANVSFLNPSTVGTRQYDGVYNARNQITAENTTIQSGTTVMFEAGNQIVLGPGFHAVAGSTFTARIGDCEFGCGNGKSEGSNDNSYEMVIFDSRNNPNAIESDEDSENESKSFSFTIYPNPTNGFLTVDYTLYVVAPICIELYNIFGHRVKLLLPQQTQNAGDYSIQTSVTDLRPDTYIIKVTSDNQVESKQVVIN